MRLERNDIIGHKLVRILQDHSFSDESLSDDALEFTLNVFVLDTERAFLLPIDEHGFVVTQIPDGLVELEHPALGSRIDGVYRPRHIEAYQSDPDIIVLHLDSGYWLWQISSAPYATASAGVLLKRELAAYVEDMDLVPYWDAVVE